MGHSHHDSNSGLVGHIIPPKTTGIVLLILLVLTGVTVAAAQFDFGNMNFVVAMGIATVKVALVITFFMHGLHENKIVWTYILIPFILVAIMIGGTFTDDPFRSKPLPFSAQGDAAKAAAPAKAAAAHGDSHH